MARQIVGGWILGLGLLFLGCDETVIRGDECTDDLNCAAEWICASQRCVPPCLLDSDCAAVSPDAVCTFNHCLVPTEVQADMQSLADATVDAEADASDDAAPADATVDALVVEPDLALVDAARGDADLVDAGEDDASEGDAAVDADLADAERADAEADAPQPDAAAADAG
jgi:hypothetical protein